MQAIHPFPSTGVSGGGRRAAGRRRLCGRGWGAQTTTVLVVCACEPPESAMWTVTVQDRCAA